MSKRLAERSTLSFHLNVDYEYKEELITVASYLLTWNPNETPWNDFQDDLRTAREQGYVDARWSCGNTKKIVEGDRLFWMRLGSEPRGIFASGWALSDSYEDFHWSESTKPAQYVEAMWDVLLDPDQGEILSGSKLNTGVLAEMSWYPQRSGVSIREDIAAALEGVWAHFLASKNIVQQHTAEEMIVLPEEFPDNFLYREGATKQVLVNAYERNAQARRACIRHYGLNCSVCGFNFERVYGELGIGLIHVHHLQPLSEASGEYELDPIRDLRPVCPNCHAIIHRRKPPYTIEEIKALLQRTF